MEAERAKQDLSHLTICIVGMNYKPEKTGIAPYTSAMAAALSEAGARVHVVTGIPHYPQWRVDDLKYLTGSYWNEQDGEITVTRCRHSVPRVANLKGRMGMELGFLRRAASVVRRDDADIVICITPSLSGLAAGLMGKRHRPIGVLVQDLTGNAALESGTTGKFFSRTIAGLEYLLLRQSTLIGVITPRFRAVLAARGLSDAHMMDLPNFTHITPLDITRREARKHLGWDQHKSYVIHTGNIGRKQGLESVLAAARLADTSNSDLQFVLVGDGNQREALRKQANGIRSLTFVDPVDEQTYPYVLAAADVLLVNEKGGVKEMSLPSKITSYAAASRPIIGAVEPGGITYEVLTAGGFAMVISTDNPKSLIDAVQSIIDDSSKIEQLATSASTYYLLNLTATSAAERYRAMALRLSQGKHDRRPNVTGQG